MTKQRVVRADEVIPFSPAGAEGKYKSRLLIESEGVGSTEVSVERGDHGARHHVRESGKSSNSIR